MLGQQLQRQQQQIIEVDGVQARNAVS